MSGSHYQTTQSETMPLARQATGGPFPGGRRRPLSLPQDLTSILNTHSDRGIKKTAIRNDWFSVLGKEQALLSSIKPSSLSQHKIQLSEQATSLLVEPV